MEINSHDMKFIGNRRLCTLLSRPQHETLIKKIEYINESKGSDTLEPLDLYHRIKNLLDIMAPLIYHYTHVWDSSLHTFITMDIGHFYDLTLGKRERLRKYLAQHTEIALKYPLTIPYYIEDYVPHDAWDNIPKAIKNPYLNKRVENPYAFILKATKNSDILARFALKCDYENFKFGLSYEDLAKDLYRYDQLHPEHALRYLNQKDDTFNSLIGVYRFAALGCKGKLSYSNEGLMLYADILDAGVLGYDAGHANPLSLDFIQSIKEWDLFMIYDMLGINAHIKYDDFKTILERGYIHPLPGAPLEMAIKWMNLESQKKQIYIKYYYILSEAIKCYIYSPRYNDIDNLIDQWNVSVIIDKFGIMIPAGTDPSTYLFNNLHSYMSSNVEDPNYFSDYKIYELLGLYTGHTSRVDLMNTYTNHYNLFEEDEEETKYIDDTEYLEGYYTPEGQINHEYVRQIHKLHYTPKSTVVYKLFFVLKSNVNGIYFYDGSSHSIKTIQELIEGLQPIVGIRYIRVPHEGNHIYLTLTELNQLYVLCCSLVDMITSYNPLIDMTQEFKMALPTLIDEIKLSIAFNEAHSYLDLHFKSVFETLDIKEQTFIMQYLSNIFDMGWEFRGWDSKPNLKLPYRLNLTEIKDNTYKFNMEITKFKLITSLAPLSVQARDFLLSLPVIDHNRGILYKRYNLGDLLDAIMGKTTLLEVEWDTHFRSYFHYSITCHKNITLCLILASTQLIGTSYYYSSKFRDICLDVNYNPLFTSTIEYG